MQWTTDGKVAIISHDTEEEAFSCAQGKEEVELSEATREGYGFGFGKKIDQHTGDCAVTYQTSRKEKLARNTYIGVWSRWSHLTAQMIAMFPVRVKM